jgi:DNA-binding winged helix-turn-helix (wHTH) protein
VFISKLRKKLRNASGGAEFIETIPQRGWILRDIDEKSGAYPQLVIASSVATRQSSWIASLRSQ